MDEIDRRLLVAWARRRSEGGGARVGKLKTYERGLRSLSLVLRADDKRIDGLGEGVVGFGGWMEGVEGVQQGVWEVRVDRGVVGRLCGPVRIDWPGVGVAEAAGLFGVNATTVRRWAKAGRVVMEREENRADRKRSGWRVWTRGGVDVGGAVWRGDWWGDAGAGLERLVGEGFEQRLLRTHRCIGSRSVVWRWLCEGCGGWVAKVYRPRRVLTVGAWLGEAAAGERWTGGGFQCRACAGLVYESSERGSRPGKGRRVDVWDRFVKRVSGGVLGGGDVERRGGGAC